MSARWPSSLLNATNKQLTERVEYLTQDLDRKRQSLTEQREVLNLLKRHRVRTEQQTTVIAKTLELERETVERDAGKLKQLHQAAEADARRARQANEAATQLSQTVSALEATIVQRQRALEEQREIAVELEEEAREVVSAHLDRQRVGDELSAAQRELSSSIWATLGRLHDKIRAATQQLEEARDERRRVVQEADAMQLALHDAVKDQAESVRALELVHAQSSQLDANVRANAEAMEVLVRASREREQLRGELRDTLDHLLAEQKRQSLTRDRHSARYRRQGLALRTAIAALREDEARSLTSARCEQAEVQQLSQLRRGLDHIMLLCDEKRQLLSQQQARRAALEDARTELQRLEQEGQPSPSALRDMLLHLSRQEATLEDRVARTHAKLTSAIQAFVDEGRKGEQVNVKLGATVQAKRSLVAEQEASEGRVQLLKEREGRLGEALVDRQALLPSMQALASEQRAQRQVSRLREVEQLRDSLLRIQRDHQQLLQGTTALRSSLHRTRSAVGEGGEAQGRILGDLQLLEVEVLRLTQETEATAEEHKKRLVQHEQAAVALQSLMKAAHAQVGALKEAAGVEAYLRAEVQIEEERLAADVRGSLVELHLYESEVHTLNEELQRHRKKLGLLRLRYEEIMASMARSAQKPLNEEHEGGSPIPVLDRESAAANPEAVHAHLLLRRSYEREQLMQRGNYLDLRLVALDRETSTLRHMLDGLRSSRPSATEHGHGVGEHAGSLLAAPASSTGELVAGRGSQVATRSPAAAKACLLSSAAAREECWRVEVQMLDSELAAMSQQRDASRSQLHEMRAALKDLQDTERQKRMLLQKLREHVQRSRKAASSPGLRRSK
ncbi:hypothetical protein NESM_000772400 [Novymonas esmeraldas]|uniref:Uncharacterized protein n=1 Tax=Novymonas esmeraldas TaxID=1808958 RepID=A0AAW0EXF9_9TRYP